MAAERPIMISRTSFSECASSGKIRASGSLNTEAASVNCTRCFLKFDLLSTEYRETRHMAFLARISSQHKARKCLRIW